MHHHVGVHPKCLATPDNRGTEEERREPDRKRKSLATQPRSDPTAERPPRRLRPRKARCILVLLNASRRVQLTVQCPVNRTPDGHTEQPQHGERRPGLRDAEVLAEERQRRDREGAVQRAEEALGPGLDQRREQHGILPDPQPADPSRDVLHDAHVRHGLDRQVAVNEAVVAPVVVTRAASGGGEDGGRDGLLPEQIANQMVLADVAAEVVYALAVGQGVQVRLAEHVALADDAGGDADRVDGGVELCVGGGHEHFL